MNIEKLLEISVNKRASDLHIKPGIAPLLRIDGSITTLKEIEPLTPEMIKQMLFSIMTKDEQTAFENNLVLELAYTVPNIGSFRVSIFHQLHGISGVFRVIPASVPSFDDIGLPASLKQLLGLSHGLILVAGPTGSGKSTTLAAMIDYINTHQICNIITIEDPIEFVHHNKMSFLNQLQVGRDTPDFSIALRASLRQDPNVIMLGELRDLETMRLALTAAETGHLVFATIHASSAPLSINRFADVFPSEEKNRVRMLLSETLQAVICQTLVKKLTGGRIAAFEIMLATPPIRHFIRNDMPAHMESTMQTSVTKGMCTLERSLHNLVTKGLISPVVSTHALASRGSFKDEQDGANQKQK